MEILTILNNLIELIPKVIGGLRNFALTTLHLSELTYSIIAFVLACLGSWAFLKQFVTGALWARASTILNFLLLALLGYILFKYTGGI